MRNYHSSRRRVAGTVRTAVLLACVTTGTNAVAQTYQIVSSSTDAGGGRSSDATFTLFGAIGQPEGDENLAGGAFSMTGGLLPRRIVAQPTAAQWVCVPNSNVWSSTSCWIGLAGSDPFPDRSTARDYDVTLPTGGYTVTVDQPGIELRSLSMPGVSTVTSISAGKSLTISNALTAHGKFLVYGDLAVDPAATIDLTQCDIVATNGGHATVPMTSYLGVSGRIEGLLSDWPNTVLDLPALTSADGGGNGMNIQASNGGTLNAPLLTSIANATLSAWYSNSLLQLDSLATLPPVTLRVESGGRVIAAPLTRLDGSIVIMNGATSVLDLAHLTNIDRASLQISGGAQAAIPLVTSYAGAPGIEGIVADNTGTLLELNALATLDGSVNPMSVRAENGATLRLPALTSAANVGFSSNIAPSRLELNSLAVVGSGVSISVQNGGTLVSAPFTSLPGIQLTVSGATSQIDTTHVTNFNASNADISQGAIVRFPLVPNYVSFNGSGLNWLRASNAGTLLDLNSAASLQGLASASLGVEAHSGGRLEARSVQSMPGYVVLRAEGTSGAYVSTLDLGNVDLASGSKILTGSAVGSPGGEVWCRGNFRHAITDATNNFKWGTEAVLRMLGGTPGNCATLETAGQDRGNVANGWSSNFQLGRLVIGPAAVVRLVDNINNGRRGGVGGNAEALYVDTLEFADGRGLLITEGLHLYYHTLVGTTGQILADPQCPGDCPGDLDGDNSVGLGDLANLLAHYGAQGASYVDGDLDGDGIVGLGDLAELLARYGSICP